LKTIERAGGAGPAKRIFYQTSLEKGWFSNGIKSEA
jgi:hypothetical protein